MIFGRPFLSSRRLIDVRQSYSWTYWPTLVFILGSGIACRASEHENLLYPLLFIRKLLTRKIFSQVFGNATKTAPAICARPAASLRATSTIPLPLHFWVIQRFLSLPSGPPASQIKATAFNDPYFFVSLLVSVCRAQSLAGGLTCLVPLGAEGPMIVFAEPFSKGCRFQPSRRSREMFEFPLVRRRLGRLLARMQSSLYPPRERDWFSDGGQF